MYIYIYTLYVCININKYKYMYDMVMSTMSTIYLLQVGHTFTFVTRGDMDRFEKMLRESADCWERISSLAIK